MLKFLVIAVIAVCSWLFVAPRIWPAHPLIATLAVTVLSGLIIEIIWRKDSTNT